ncbi:uncharacterized protein DNG_09467 [Cephalotrichum gorgonifer]|uniref:Rhodopsin domain-containing protein n=1 Tax=Cephalotrichum gorgonifer TaxID=2041049 RepID=A0AAE8N7U5_9PEZI|nr:uncharacterized protein DNG_09467 [Cephalotrichum gorgonifer]
MDAEKKDIVDYGPLLKGSIWFMTAMSTTFLGLRVFAKLSRHRPLWWDDGFLIASWFALVISVSLLTEGVKYGIGLHYEDMILENMQKTAKFSYAAGFATILGTSWSKTSFGITLLRISNGWVKLFVWFIIISLNLVLSASAIILFVQCRPIQRLFTQMVDVYSGVGDIVLALLPWKIVWNATIFRREKIGALIAMSMGVFSGIMSFVKISSLSNITDISYDG